MALAVFYGEDSRQSVAYPKLLLLDEIDAPLHPSMTRSLIRTLDGFFVRRIGMSVILATHSPSTVALAPEESLYVMKSNAPGLHQVRKGAAINMLLEGVPTLSISFDGRRQVFVESAGDAELYDLLFQKLRRILNHERSLAFIGVGTRPSNGADIDGGCARVVSVVKTLAEGGNKSVLGLIDWDKKHTSSSRVHVLAEGRRYAIENCLLDPLLVALFLVHGGHARSQLGIGESESYAMLLHSDANRLQMLVDTIQLAVLTKAHVPSEDQRAHKEVTYTSGLRLKVATAYLQMDAHQLHSEVFEAFPQLKSHGRPDATLKKLINTVLTDAPELVPIELTDAMRFLLECDI
jgi:hypothetical protein